MKLKDLYSFKIVRATQQKDRREELEILNRAAALLFSEGEELVRARDYAKGLSDQTCSYIQKGSRFLVEEDKEKILSVLDRYKKVLLKAKDLIERVPFEEEVDEFTKIVNEHKAEIKRNLEGGLARLESAIIACSDIDLSSTQTCRESSRRCYRVIDEAHKVLGPTTAFIYTLIGELETGIIL